jgi:hypothetical protein
VRSARPTALIAGVLALTGVSAAEAAAPRLILVSGPPLVRPIVISDWSDNGVFFSEVAYSIPVGRRGLAARPSFRLSFFWDQRWSDYVAEGRSLRAVCPCQTPYRGRFWPAYRSAPAVVDLGHGYYAGTKLATGKLLGVLRRHRVPVRCLDRGCRSHLP